MFRDLRDYQHENYTCLNFFQKKEVGKSTILNMDDQLEYFVDTFMFFLNVVGPIRGSWVRSESQSSDWISERILGIIKNVQSCKKPLI